jgi:CRISPR-associated protein Cas1
MLYSQVESAILSIGLDSSLGILHRDGYAKPTLSYDLIEPFRPVIDKLLIEAIEKHQLPMDVLETNTAGEAQLTRQVRVKLISLWTERLHSHHVHRGRRATLASLILTEVKLLADIIRKHEESE